MNKIINFALICIVFSLLILINSCKREGKHFQSINLNSSNKITTIYNDKAGLGVIKDGIINFYHPIEGGSWERSTKENDFKIPHNSDELICLNREIIGVRDGKTVNFYEFEAENNRWAISSKLGEFRIPVQCDELFTFGYFIGVRQGLLIKHYCWHPDKKEWLTYRYNSSRFHSPDTIIPDFFITPETDQIIDGYGVLKGKSVKFFGRIKDNNWECQLENELELNSEIDEVLSLGNSIGVRCGKVMKFYCATPSGKFRVDNLKDFNYFD